MLLSEHWEWVRVCVCVFLGFFFLRKNLSIIVILHEVVAKGKKKKKYTYIIYIINKGKKIILHGRIGCEVDAGWVCFKRRGYIYSHSFCSSFFYKFIVYYNYFRHLWYVYL